MNLANRLKSIDLKNRFQSFYDIPNCSGLRLLDFGIGQDNSIINSEMIEYFQTLIKDRDDWKYAENGIDDIYPSFIRYAKVHYGTTLSLENISLTMGIKECLNALAFILIDVGDTVIVTTPGYNVFARKAKLLGANVIELPLLKENDYLPKIEDVSDEVWSKTKVIVLNYPNNPTGALANDDFIRQVCEIGRKHDILVINDGAYIDYQYGESHSFLKYGSENVVELYSASKSFGMTGARVGLVAGEKRVIEALRSYRDQENSGQFIPLQKAYKYCLDNVSIDKDKYLKRSKELNRVLTSVGFESVKLKGAFYLFYRCPKYINGLFMGPSYHLASFLKNSLGILTIPYDGYLRFSLTYKSDDDILELVNRLNKFTFSY